MCRKVTWETILWLREWNVSFMVTASIQLPAASLVESMNAPVCLEQEAFVSGRSSQIWSDCLAKPLWTGKRGFFSVHFSYRLSENGWGICFYDDKPDGAMGPRRLQLPLSGEWGRAMLLFLLQQPWNGACRFHQLQKMIASTFIALGGELSLGKRKGKKRIDIFLPGNMADAFRNEAIASLFPPLPMPASVLKNQSAWGLPHVCTGAGERSPGSLTASPSKFYLKDLGAFFSLKVWMEQGSFNSHRST